MEINKQNNNSLSEFSSALSSESLSLFSFHSSCHILLHIHSFTFSQSVSPVENNPFKMDSYPRHWAFFSFFFFFIPPNVHCGGDGGAWCCQSAPCDWWKMQIGRIPLLPSHSHSPASGSTRSAWRLRSSPCHGRSRWWDSWQSWTRRVAGRTFRRSRHCS